MNPLHEPLSFTRRGALALGLSLMLFAMPPAGAQPTQAPAGTAAGASGAASATAATAASGTAAAARETPAQQPVASLKQFVVTGSRIPRTEKEGSTPVTVITGKELDEKGYRNVFDALQQQTQNTGFTQGSDYGNTFTPAANAISLRGLGPNHTLVLIDGHRLADYPIAYDGNVNFTNLANIPSAMVERIEILNGAASAVYGSDAIAGVVNIIMKKHINGVEVNVKGGGATRGGGENGRLQITGGKELGDLSAVFGLEVSKTRPIWARERDFMSSETLEGETPRIVWSRRNLDTGKYFNASGPCSALNGIGAFGGSVSSVTGGKGTYCGSGQALPAYWTTQTDNSSENLYGGVEYRLNEHATLFGSVSAAFNQTENNTRGPNWTSLGGSTGYFHNALTDANEQWTKRFSPEEIGGVTNWNKRWDDRFGNLITGIRGTVPGTGTWNYELSYSASGYQSRATRPILRAGIDSYFLGPQLGTTADGTPIYAPDPSRFSSPVTPGQFSSLYGQSSNQNNTWTQTVSLSGNGELFKLPAGAVKAAGVIEYGTQGFSNTVDSALNQGAYYNQNGIYGASGNRKRYAAEFELRIPVFKQLIANVATRYDDYSFAGTRNHKFTYDLGIEYRPLRELLLRGNYGTSFRAPDMNYIFQAPTKGYFESTTDYYRCAQSGQPIASCQYARVSPGSNFVQMGNHNLKPENGKSWSAGFVLAPTPDIDLSADYYNIRIDNLVTNIDPDNLLRTESACRSGQLNANSVDCQDALRRVVRNPLTAVLDPGAINTILVNPINAAMEKTTGFDLTGKWRFRLRGWGTLLWTVNFTKVLSHKYQENAGGAVVDVLHSLQNPTGNPEWPDKLMTSVTWSLPKWTTTVQVERYGKVPNAAQTAYLSPTTLANLSVSHQFTKDTSLTLVVNNVFDTIKHDDSSGWPYYPVGYYMPYGRTVWLEFAHRFN
ncbi:TonB-dependent receptor domain-containing protein [Burkholderia singularis]|uniref:Outer membrane receptor proteins, mostly Fe transport n=1 Tax=Burkholderia singularis TaxID=1503053 RepID=A0A238HCI0_9BURK|nr:TonB-dependent receptor [Burkholderia singularis]SMG02878.1 Outer membrane receptor proteins, mostly Fe transport [Burkholderia singularis]